MRKKSLIILVIFIAVFTATALIGCNKETESSYVTLEINPSIELTVNAKGEITQANGVNNDGKMLIANQELIGKQVKVAAEIIIDDCIETGYLYEASAELKISWTGAEDAKAEKNLEKLKKAIDSKLDKVGLDIVVETLESKKELLKSYAKEYDATLTEDELNAMEYKTLMSYAELNILEKSKLPTVELEEYYQSLKDYEFEFKKREAIINSLTGLAAIGKEYYITALNSFKNLTDQLLKVKEKYFLNPDSDYNKAILALEEKRDEKRVIQVKLSLTVNDTSKTAELTADLEIINTAIEVAISALNAIKETAVLAIDQAVLAIDGAVEVLDNLPVFQEADYNAVLDKVRDGINGTKNEFLTKFEEDYSQSIRKHNERITQRQEKIKASIAEAKK